MVSSNNFKITSPMNDSKSSISSLTNLKKDFKKLSIVTGHKNTVIYKDLLEKSR
jgi:hypothetical protein